MEFRNPYKYIFVKLLIYKNSREKYMNVLLIK